MLEIFQISIAVLVSLTGLTAAIAEGAPQLAFTLPIALATWYFVDYKQILITPRWVSLWLALGAFVVPVLEFSAMTDRSYLAAANHLLAYLTWVLLLQRKQIRTYWSLLALSISQIAVTSLLTFSMWFGIALLAYSLLASWTLSIFLLYRSVKSLSDDDTDILAADRIANVRTKIARLWSGVSRDRHERLVTGRFYRNTVVTTGVVLFIASLFFLFIPRIWATMRTGKSGVASAPLTGFSEEVRLGDIGEILESDENVMTVRVYDNESGALVNPHQTQKLLGTDPLFRGAVLEEYYQGRWHRPQSKASRRLDEGYSDAKYRLRIDLAPLGSGVVFSLGNTMGATPAKSYGAIRWDYFSNELDRGEETDLSRDFTYDLYITDGPPDLWLSQQRKQLLTSQFGYHLRSGRIHPLSPRRFQESLKALTQLPDDMAALYPITAQVVEGATTPLEIANKINDWFTSSGEFNYTMKLKVKDTSVDPIIDFLQNRKEGHCEYFASAMATMLRCAEVPSRVITGFKGGLYNPTNGTLQVRQFHAHAWVEAYIDGLWMTFDPTPPARDESVSHIEGRPSTWIHTWRTAEGFWHRMSLLSRDAQEERIYQPLVKRVQDISAAVTELMQGRTGAFQELLKFFTSPERWFSTEGGIVAFLLFMLFAAVSWLIRRIYQASRTLKGYLRSQNRAADSRTPRVPFYDRLVGILKQVNITQAPTQTAREYIQSAIPKLEPLLAGHGLPPWPDNVVEKFYRVRFGHEELSPTEVHELEEQLNNLESCLKESQVVTK